MKDWRNSRAWRMLVSRYGESEARAIVYYVMETCFNIKKEDFLADGLDSLRPEQVPRLMAMLLKTAEGTPVQYVTGLADFGGRHGYTYIGVRPGGALYFELNPLTADKTAEMARREGFAEVGIREDCYGKRRMMKAVKAG